MASRGGLRAGSSPMSIRLSTGSGLVVGDDPVQRTSRSAETIVGPGNFSSGELIVTLQLLDCCYQLPKSQNSGMKRR